MAKLKKGVTPTSEQLTAVADARIKALADSGGTTNDPTRTPESPAVVRTDALQRRIDARKAQAQQPTPAVVDQSVIDTSTGLPQGIQPTTTETTPTKETTPPVTSVKAGMTDEEIIAAGGKVVDGVQMMPAGEKTAPVVKEPAKTPEEQAKFDEQQKQQEEEYQKAEADKAKADALKAEEAKRQAEANQKGEQVVQSQDEAFAVLQSGGKLPKTADSAVYESKWRAYQKINGMDSTSIANSNIQGDIAPSLLDMMAKYNPTKYAEVMQKTDDGIKVDGINKANERIYNKSTGQKTETISKSEEALNDIEKIIKSDKPSIRDLRQKYLLDNQKIKDGAVELAEKDGEIEEIQDEIERTYDDLRGQYPTLPKSMLMGMAATQTRDLNRTLTTKIRERNIIFAEYQANKEEANAMMNFEMQVVAEERADRAETIKFMQDKYNSLKTDEMWQKEKDYQTEAARIAYERGDIQAAKQHDRNLEILNITQDFQKEESRLQREQAWKIVEKQMEGSDWKTSADTKTDDNGREYFTQVNEKTGEIRKKYVDEIDVPSSTTVSADGKTPAVTGTDAEGNDFWKLDVPNDTVIGDRWQCGEVVNDKNPSLKGRVLDYYAQKKKLIEEGREPVAGDMFVSNIGVTDENATSGEGNNGHVGWVTKVMRDANGNITALEIQDSNFYQKDGKGVMNTRIVKTTDPFFKTITGYSPTKASASGSKGQGMEALTDAIANGIQRAGSNFKAEEFKNNMLRVYKRDGVGSQALYDVIASYATATEGANGQIAGVISNQKQLDDVYKLVDDYKASGGNMNDLLGLKGNVNKNIERLRNSIKPGMNVSDTTKTKINLQIMIMEQMQKYRKSMTGAAASIMEAEEYKEMFPGGADGADITFSMLDSYKSRVDSLLDGYLGMTFGQQAINVLLPKRQNKSFSSLLNDDKFIIKQNTNNLPDFFNSYLNIGNVPLP